MWQSKGFTKGYIAAYNDKKKGRDGMAVVSRWKGERQGGQVVAIASHGSRRGIISPECRAWRIPVARANCHEWNQRAEVRWLEAVQALPGSLTPQGFALVQDRLRLVVEYF